MGLPRGSRSNTTWPIYIPRMLGLVCRRHSVSTYWKASTGRPTSTSTSSKISMIRSTSPRRAASRHSKANHHKHSVACGGSVMRSFKSGSDRGAGMNSSLAPFYWFQNSPAGPAKIQQICLKFCAHVRGDQLPPQQWARSPSSLGCRWFIRRPRRVDGFRGKVQMITTSSAIIPIPAASAANATGSCERLCSGRPGFRCLGEIHRNQAASPLVFFAYESFQDKARNGSRCDCARSNRRRSHTRAGTPRFAEGQNARSSDYRQSTRLARTEVARITPRHTGGAEDRIAVLVRTPKSAK
jgi:hypothetical protein